MQAAAQVTELEVPLQSRVAWLRRNYSYFEDEHKDLLMAKLDALTKTSGKKVCSPAYMLVDLDMLIWARTLGVHANRLCPNFLQLPLL